MQSGPQDYTTAWKNALSDIAGKNSEMHERSLAHAMACASIAAYSIVHYDPCIWRVLRGRIYGVIAWNSVLRFGQRGRILLYTRAVAFMPMGPCCHDVAARQWHDCGTMASTSA